MIDARYARAIGAFNWFVGTHGYAVRNAVHTFGTERPGSAILLHRFLLGAEESQMVDHVNGDKMDCRVANLRLATDGQNAANKTMLGNRTGYKGVERINHGTGNWRARIMVGRRCIHLGVFPTPVEAARAYDRAAVEHFGEFARTNAQIHSWT